MTITNHPLHRSGRALLTHPAPALGDDAKSPQGISVPILQGCLPYPTRRNLHVCPVQCPVRVLPRRFPFGQTPSLHPLRRHFSGLVQGLRHYYRSVRLPAVVLHRRSSLDFSMRPTPHFVGGRRISRFSRRLLPCMLGVSDLAGYHRTSPSRPVGCCLPLLSTGSASRTIPFRGSIPSLHVPLSTLRLRSYERRCMTRGRYGWLDL